LDETEPPEPTDEDMDRRLSALERVLGPVLRPGTDALRTGTDALKSVNDRVVAPAWQRATSIESRVPVMCALAVAITLTALVWWRYRREDLSHVRRASGAEITKTFVIALPALALPFVIRAAVVEGVATATEVSTIGIVYGLLVGLLVYRRFDWRRLMPMLIETAALSGAILLIIGTATGMAWGLTQSGFSRALAAAMTGLPGGAASFIAVSIVAFTILGSVLEGIPAIVLFGPLLFPIARAVGVH
jgi:TRAP-type C4-dicarboxylate transport system permease large subunit